MSDTEKKEPGSTQADVPEEPSPSKESAVPEKKQREYKDFGEDNDKPTRTFRPLIRGLN
jgi:hypothetical protein